LWQREKLEYSVKILIQNKHTFPMSKNSIQVQSDSNRNSKEGKRKGKGSRSSCTLDMMVTPP
jgi:hypothetical protein